MEEVEFPRGLLPKEKVMGLPELVLFSDASTLAFGAVAYIRQRISAEKWW